MRLSVVLFLLFFVISAGADIPGKLVIVGGGSEKINGWSDAPYGWALEKSENKRVAIITYSADPTGWLPNYFVNLGAAEAKNFIIPDETTADLQETYDSLITYDVIFFKGGDQWNYYDYYKNTLTHQAIEDVFENGGVICGTSAGLAILSGVIFTAENGTVYPEEALEDPFNYYMTLENDFLQLFLECIFDSHFVERARFGRLIGFLGNRKIGHEENLTGIGVDDKTAFCIDSDLMGYAYGTGAANIYKANEDNDFRLSGEKLLANSVEVKQLLHECTINLNTFEYSGLDTWTEPDFLPFDYHNPLWLSGSNKIFDNTLMLEQFTQSMTPADTVLIITGLNTSSAGFFEDYITDDLGKQVLIFQATETNSNNELWKLRIENMENFLFVGNTYETLMDFLHTTANGAVLTDQLNNAEKQVAFAGGDSRFAGHTVLVNYDQVYASYDGLLEFGPGLDLLRNTIVMPNTFSEDIDNENAAAGVPYGMVLENLRFGVWLFDDCVMLYNPLDDVAEITSYGDFPMIWIENEGTWSGFSTQSAVSSGEPRDVAGFGTFTLALLDSSVTRQYDRVENISEIGGTSLSVFPNPAGETLYINGAEEIRFTLFTLKGEVVLTGIAKPGEGINISDIEPGGYLIRVSAKDKSINYSSKLIIR